MALSAATASGLVAAGLTKLATDAGARDAVTGAVKGAARDVAYQAGRAAKAASPVLREAARNAGREAEYYSGKVGDAVRGIPGTARAAAHNSQYYARRALRKTAELRKGLSAEQIKGELSRFKGRAQKAVMDGVSHFKFTKPGGGSAFVTKSAEGVRGPMTQAAYRAHVGSRNPFIPSGSKFKQSRLDRAVSKAREE